jgi:hypothetical protein
MVKSVTEGRPTAVGIGRPRLSWEGDVREDLGRMKIRDWSKVAMDTETWKKNCSEGQNS